jgi:hypothetical protein
MNETTTSYSAASMLAAIYAQEIDVRLENSRSGFFHASAGFTWQRPYNGNTARLKPGEQLPEDVVFDWSERFSSPSIDEALSQLFYSIAKKKPGIFDHPSIDKNKDVPLAETLIAINKKGILFRIETIWDIGYYVAILDPKVVPTSTDVDEHNLGLAGSGQPYIPRPEKDILKQGYPENVEELNKWLMESNGFLNP